MAKWTVGFVNWKSVDYLYYQFKMLYDFNNDFELIVVDNTFPNQTKALEDIQKEFEFKLISHDGIEYQTHGLGLTKILQAASSKYILFQDPDFFWEKRSHLAFLEQFLIQGFLAVGAAFVRNDFPSAYGAAYVLDEIQDLNLDAIWKTCPACKHGFLVDPDMDTGWQLRLRLKNKPYMSFPIKDYQGAFFGLHSYEFYGNTFTYNKLPIAHHLGRGSYPIEDPNKQIPSEWADARRAYSKHFYDISKE